MDVVKSSLEQQVEKHVAELAKVNEAKALVNARIAFAKRQLSGTLSFAEFKTLKPEVKRGYVRTFGTPKTDNEILAAKNKKTKTKKANKMAKRSRARNRP
jgi:hypothetical protein